MTPLTKHLTAGDADRLAPFRCIKPDFPFKPDGTQSSALYRLAGPMSGIYYGLSIVAIFVIIKWVISNDRTRPDKPTTGLLAMKDNQSSNKREKHRAPR